MRKIGETHAMILNIKSVLEDGGKAAVLECKDPKSILDRLNKEGIKAKAKPMMKTEPQGMKEKQVGYTFYCT